MIKIVKNHEPNSLAEYRNEFKEKPDSDYPFKNLKEEKSEIQESILKEQKYICAYCMCSIDLQGKVYDSSKIGIEHWHSQKWSKQNRANQKKDYLDITYSNMLGVCNGGNRHQEYCESVRGDKILVINPLDEDHIRKIKYTKSGVIYIYNKEEKKDEYEKFKEIHEKLIKKKETIKKEQEKWETIKNYTIEESLMAMQYDIDETLKLNHKILKDQRQAIINGVMKVLENNKNKRNLIDL